MALLLLIIYVIILILQIICLVFSFRKKIKKLWICLLLFDFISMVTALMLMFYYDSLPGYGFMPGLTYLGEIAFSFCATVVYLVMLLVSFISFLCMRRKINK